MIIHYDAALTTSLIDSLLDSPHYEPNPELPYEWECAHCLRPVVHGVCQHTATCPVTKAEELKASYRTTSDNSEPIADDAVFW